MSGVMLSACVTSEPDIAPLPVNAGSKAAVACRAAIARQVGVSVGDVAVFETIESEAGTRVRASVAGAVDPWACLSSNDGVVAEVNYTGNEGSL